MSKLNFANNVINKVPPFDSMNFESFIPVFEMIEKIIAE